MGRINSISTLIQSVADVAGLRRFTASALDAILQQVNGKLDFGDNVRTFGPVAVSFAAGAQETKVIHGLGRTPMGFFVVDADRAVSVYSPVRAVFPWNETQIYLVASVASEVQVLLF